MQNTPRKTSLSKLEISPDQKEQFHRQGYLILENILAPDQIDRIISRFAPIFATQFETGIYPDEWYGRPGLSLPNATRHMTGIWRCDRTLASFTLSEEIARINATLMDWEATRYGFDACWIKPPNAPTVSFHRNNTFAASLDPASVVTTWIALSDTTAEAGTLEVVPGSHRWPSTDKVRFLHAPKEDYRTHLWQAAETAGVSNSEILPVELAPGNAIFFHGDLWHGSNRNQTTDQTRRSLSISTLPGNTRFRPSDEGQGYIFSGYRRIGDVEMDDSFFPILWSRAGDRSSFLANYCPDALAYPGPPAQP